MTLKEELKDFFKNRIDLTKPEGKKIMSCARNFYKHKTLKVWHDAEKQSKKDGSVLIRREDGVVLMGRIDGGHFFFREVGLKGKRAIEYAYIEDLLPTPE